MIAKPSIAFNDFSGSAKSVTARSVKGRTILSSKAYHSGSITPAQAVSRNALSKISRAYKQLSDSQMKSWESLALHLKSKPSLGTSTTLTAHNAFVRINSNRQMLGQPLLTDAPDYINTIPAVKYGSVWVTTKRILLSGIEAPNSDYKLLVKMSAGQSIGVTSGWDKAVIITPGMADDWGDVPLTRLYNEKIGFLPKENEKVFIEMYWIDPDSGMTGEAARTSIICTSETSAKENGFVERTIINTDDIVDEVGVQQLKIECTPEDSYVAIEANCTGADGVAVSVAEIHNMPDAIANTMTYIVGRGQEEDQFERYVPQTAVVWLFKRTSGSSVEFAHRGGVWRKPIDYFGTGVLVKY